MLKRILDDYGMILVLLGLCVLFSLLTLKRQMPEGPSAVRELVKHVRRGFDASDVILAVGAANTMSAELAQGVGQELQKEGFSDVHVVIGEPRDLRQVLEQVSSEQKAVAAIVTAGDVVKWRIVEHIPEYYPASAGYRLLTPTPITRSTFLKSTNLLAIVDRIVVIAVIAIGMTMVIITAGIDLSVGSIIALCAVVSTYAMKEMGGQDASGIVVVAGFAIGMLACALVGTFTGVIVARYKVPSFIVTLSIMMMARGEAFTFTGGFSIYQVPDSLTWLGQGSLLGIPNTVILLTILYIAAHIFMSRTPMGRYIYAVGGNEEAARLSGVPVKRVIVFVYVVSALMAGLGGCIQASQLNSGTPNMGNMYELYVIAAVVVGGTSLAGGSGRILGTLIGAFIISVIQNGMNLIGIGSYTQQIVLGAVILGAVLVDNVRGGKT